jgi:hypothetical protein
MKNKDIVKRTYPRARSERHKGSDGKAYWVIRNEVTHEHLSKFRPTENAAWASASERIQRDLAIKESIVQNTQ